MPVVYWRIATAIGPRGPPGWFRRSVPVDDRRSAARFRSRRRAGMRRPHAVCPVLPFPRLRSVDGHAGRLPRARPRDLVGQGRPRGRRDRRRARRGRASAGAGRGGRARGRAGPRGVVGRGVGGAARVGLRGRVTATAPPRPGARRARSTRCCRSMPRVGRCTARSCGATGARSRRPSRSTRRRTGCSASGRDRWRSPGTCCRSGCGCGGTRPTSPRGRRGSCSRRTGCGCDLTDVVATDRTEASSSLLFDIGRKAWAPDLLAMFDVPATLLPTVVRSSDVAGRVSAAVAEQEPLPVGLPVVGGAGDNEAAALGCGAVGDGKVAVVLGTSATVIAHHATRGSAGGLVWGRHALRQGYAATGVVLSAGRALEWVRRAAFPSDFTTDEVVEAAAASDPSAGPLVFVPSLAGERSPVPDPTASGAFVWAAPRPRPRAPRARGARGRGPRSRARAARDARGRRAGDGAAAHVGRREVGVLAWAGRGGRGTCRSSCLARRTGPRWSATPRRPVHRGTRGPAGRHCRPLAAAEAGRGAGSASEVERLGLARPVARRRAQRPAVRGCPDRSLTT